MMSVLSDVSLRRAGFDVELRDRIAAAWRAEDYTTAGQPHPRRAARRVHAVRHARGRRGQGDGLPRRDRSGPAAAPAGPPGRPPDRRAPRRGDASTPDCRRAEDSRAGSSGRAGPGRPGRRPASLATRRSRSSGRRLGATWEILRPFAFTASVIPVLAGGALASGRWRLRPGARSSRRCSGRCSCTPGRTSSTRSTTSARAIDTITSPRASHAIVKGRMTERGAFTAGVRGVRAGDRGRPLPGRAARSGDRRARADRAGRRLRLHGAAVPVQVPRPRRAARVPADGPADGRRLVLRDQRARGRRPRSSLSIPVGLLVAAILHGNEWRDIREDTRAGIVDAVVADRPRLGALRLRRRSSSARTSASASRPSRSGSCRRRRCSRSSRCRSSPQVIRSAELGRERPGAGDRDDRPPDGAAPPRVRVAARARPPAVAGRRWLTPGRRGARRPRRVVPGALGRAGRGAGGVRGHVPRPARAVLAADDADRARARVRWRCSTSRPARADPDRAVEVALGLASAAALYATFQVGDRFARRFVPGRRRADPRHLHAPDAPPAARDRGAAGD